MRSIYLESLLVDEGPIQIEFSEIGLIGGNLRWGVQISGPSTSKSYWLVKDQ
jgi:hypothetical protein